LDDAADQLGLSARAYVKVLRVARTVADLQLSEEVDTSHLIEAIQARHFETDATHRPMPSPKRKRT
jgi:magnesium chelatase family protein